MREINFRFWDTENKKMIYSDEIAFKGFSTVYEIFNSDKFKAMQYTGISINDTEICEGDLLEIKGYSEGVLFSFIGIVKYDDGTWWVCDTQSSYMDCLVDLHTNEEINDVIGNIYEGVENNE